MIVVSVPALEFWVFSTLQNVLLTLKVRMVVTDPSAALHADRVHPVHKTTILEVITVSINLQPLSGEASALIKHDLKKPKHTHEWYNLTS